MFESFINPLLAPLLDLPPLASITIIALGISILITLVYRWMTDQDLMKSLKDEMKKLQKEMKELKHDPKKMMAVQKQAMEKNMKYMMHSMKPTLITFLPIIIIFGWLNGHLAFHPIAPGQEFTTTLIAKTGGSVTITVPEGVEIIGGAVQEIKNGLAVWTLKGEAGQYLLEYDMDGRTYTKELLITEERAYKTPVEKKKDDYVASISIDNEKIRPLNLFGWRLGWLGTYIILSIVFSMTLRKILKLH
ncbi:MAG: EMC3/TMCO1 family protein [archaeon]